MNKDIVLGFFSNHDTRKTETGRQRQRAESEQRTWRVHNSADKRARPKPEEEMKAIAVHNPDNLKTAPYTDFIELQGDLKTLPPENLEKLKQSIITYGIRFPAFIWLSESKKYIVDAHQRKKAFVALEAEGYIVSEVPYTLIHAANKKEAAELLLQANSRYGTLNESTTFFDDFDIDLSFIEDIEIPELDIKLEEFQSAEIAEDEVPELPDEPITKRGELWTLGRHCVLCGDSTDKADVKRIMNGNKADMLFTDMPYGVSYADKNAFLNAIDKGNRIQDKIEGDHQTVADMKKLWVTALQLAFQYSKRGTVYYICSPQGGELMMMMMMSILEAGWNLKQSIIWVKNNHVLGRSDYHYKHEPLLYGWKESPHRFYGGTSETTVWEIDKPHKSELHPTQKPIELPIRAIRNSTKENNIVIDFFLGSGTTLIACEQLERTCYGMEIEPRYIDIILDRWAKLTGEEPLREDGITWSELKTENGIQ